MKDKLIMGGLLALLGIVIFGVAWFSVNAWINSMQHFVK